MKLIGKIAVVALVVGFLGSMSFSTSASCTLNSSASGECHIVIDNSGPDPVHSLECEDPDPDVGGSSCKKGAATLTIA